MKSRICVCCGEPMSAEGNPLSRNPNVCASCSSLWDGMDETGKSGVVPHRTEPPAVPPEIPASPEQASEPVHSK